MLFNEGLLCPIADSVHYRFCGRCGYYISSLGLIKVTFAYLFASSLNIMDSKRIFALVNGATYFWIY
jgi:hypothetical protein